MTGAAHSAANGKAQPNVFFVSLMFSFVPFLVFGWKKTAGLYRKLIGL